MKLIYLLPVHAYLPWLDMRAYLQPMDMFPWNTYTQIHSCAASWRDISRGQMCINYLQVDIFQQPDDGEDQAREDHNERRCTRGGQGLPAPEPPRTKAAMFAKAPKVLGMPAYAK